MFDTERKDTGIPTQRWMVHMKENVFCLFRNKLLCIYFQWAGNETKRVSGAQKPCQKHLSASDFESKKSEYFSGNCVHWRDVGIYCDTYCNQDKNTCEKPLFCSVWLKNYNWKSMTLLNHILIQPLVAYHIFVTKNLFSSPHISVTPLPSSRVCNKFPSSPFSLYQWPQYQYFPAALVL